MLGLDNPLHILVLLVVVLLVFGAKRLPEMGKSLGEGLRGFKSAISDEPSVHLSDEASIPSRDEPRGHALSSLEPTPTVLDETTPVADRSAQPVASARPVA
jgi:sec-independent protein translocase protein TatA